MSRWISTFKTPPRRRVRKFLAQQVPAAVVDPPDIPRTLAIRCPECGAREGTRLIDDRLQCAHCGHIRIGPTLAPIKSISEEPVNKKMLQSDVEAAMESAPAGRKLDAVLKALKQDRDGRPVADLLRDDAIPEDIEKSIERPAPTIARLAQEKIRALVEAASPQIWKLQGPARERALDLEVGRRLNGRSENQQLVKLLRLSYWPGASETTDRSQLIRKSENTAQLIDLLGEL